MAAFSSLPVEIRLAIYDIVIPGPIIQSTKPLGFRNPCRELPHPNVVITLRLPDLVALYLSNPAGRSSGRFCESMPILRVSREARREAGEILSKRLVEIRTWMNFLRNRPPGLISAIRSIRFTYYVQHNQQISSAAHSSIPDDFPKRWWPDHIIRFWEASLDHATRLDGLNLEQTSVTLALSWPPSIICKIPQGIRGKDIGFLMPRLVRVLRDALSELPTDGTWPHKTLVIENTDEAFATDLQGNLTL